MSKERQPEDLLDGPRHGKLVGTPVSRAVGSQKLSALVDLSIETLEQVMRKADWPMAFKAAIAVLDRTGFGAKTGLEITHLQESVDLTALSPEQLEQRAAMLAKRASVARAVLEGGPNGQKSLPPPSDPKDSVH